MGILNDRIQSFQYAFQGLKTLWKTQANMRIHLILTTGVVISGLVLEISRLEWCVLLLTFSLVLMAEAFNTALEFLTDLASPEYHPLAKHAKDVAAAAVLLTAFGAAVVGILILGPALLQKLEGI